MTAFIEGVVAGYGIAVPVGAIAVLIINTSLRGGFRMGFMAGAGAGSADLIYAALAAIVGEVIAAALAPVEVGLQVASGIVLLALGAAGLWRTRKTTTDEDATEAEIRGGLRTYSQFLGLTLLNPLTVAYFGALILGGGTDALDTLPGRVMFVAGAWLASFSWQTLLATIGALGKRHLPPQFRVLTSVMGNLVVVGLGLRVLVRAMG